MHAAVAGCDAPDPVNDLRARNHAPEYTVTPALRVARLMIEESVVGDVDEKLRGRRMRVAGAGHRDAVARILEPVRGFVLDRGLRRLLPELGREAAALDHEAVDD